MPLFGRGNKKDDKRDEKSVEEEARESVDEAVGAAPQRRGLFGRGGRDERRSEIRDDEAIDEVVETPLGDGIVWDEEVIEEEETLVEPSSPFVVEGPASSGAMAEAVVEEEEPEAKSPESTQQRRGWFGRGRRDAAVDERLEEKTKVEVKTEAALTKTRRSWFGRITGILDRTTIDEDLWLELEEVLLGADVGVKTTDKVLSRVRERVEDDRVTDPHIVRGILKDELMTILESVPLKGALWGEHVETPPRPGVILVVGVNGTGKTTSIAKLAHLYHAEGEPVVVAAGDTFRAAAIDQLRSWADKLGVQVVAHKEGADPSAVAFDAIGAAQSRNAAVAIIDTAGRLHTKFNLMEELRKVRRVIERKDPTAPHEVLLVLDATTGQNALVQAKAFAETVDVTAIALTKLDGTSKGGIVFAICDELALPVRFVGTGESEDDLSPFDPEAFVDALFE